MPRLTAVVVVPMVRQFRRVMFVGRGAAWARSSVGRATDFCNGSAVGKPADDKASNSGNPSGAMDAPMAIPGQVRLRVAGP